MRVLIAYNRYRHHVQGEQIAIDLLTSLLETRGHIVAVFVSDTVNMGAGLFAKSIAALGGLYSPEIKSSFTSALLQFKPDIVHFHNLYPRLGLTAPSVCNSASVPAVISLHNYFLTCPIAKHFRNNKICVECSLKNSLPCALNNCRQNLIESLVYSGRSAIASAAGIHLRFDGYISQSNFSREMLVKQGVSLDRIHLLPNFSRESHSRPICRQDRLYFVFVGRLVPEKGLRDILELAGRQPDIHFKVAGGPPPSDLAEWPVNAEYVGELQHEDALSLIANSMCLIFCSKWFEMCPLVLLEAMRLSTPIIATRVGGIPELIKDGERGFLYDPGDIETLQMLVNSMRHDASLCERFANNALGYALKEHSEDVFYERLMKIYRQVVARRKGADSNDACF